MFFLNGAFQAALQNYYYGYVSLKQGIYHANLVRIKHTLCKSISDFVRHLADRFRICL
jgi:hypothetical protein